MATTLMFAVQQARWQCVDAVREGTVVCCAEMQHQIVYVASGKDDSALKSLSSSQRRLQLAVGALSCCIR